jgi:hypothetical protein
LALKKKKRKIASITYLLPVPIFIPPRHTRDVYPELKAFARLIKELKIRQQNTVKALAASVEDRKWLVQIGQPYPDQQRLGDSVF